MLPGLNLQTEGEWRSRCRRHLSRRNRRAVHVDWDPKIVGPCGPARRTPSCGDSLALSSVPMLAFRGETSTVLSAETFERMAASHRNFVAVTIAGTGHTVSRRARSPRCHRPVSAESDGR